MLTPAQMAERTKGIGASECAIVLGISEYCTPYKLWMIKTGKIAPDDLSENEAVWWGNELEPVVAKRYEHETGERIFYDEATRFHQKYPFILCHPDRYVYGKTKIIEIKSARYNPEKWGEVGSDYVPLEYICQIQHQLAVLGEEYKEADLIVYFTNVGRCQTYTIKRDEELISIIINRIAEFWNEYVLKNMAPSLINISDFKLRYPSNVQEFIEADESSLEWLNVLKSIRARISREEQQEEECIKHLMAFIGDKCGITKDNKILVTWKADKNGRRNFRISEK